MIAKKQTSAQPLRWDDARYFLALWRQGSLQQAARSLEVNISTVSRRLERLEEAQGARLFDRTPDGVLPTAAARRLAPFAEGMEHAAVGFAQGLADFETEVAGVVHLTVPPGLVESFLSGALPGLFERHPKLRLDLSASTGYLDLNRRQADIALRAMRPQSGDVVAKRLVCTGWTLVGSPAQVQRLGRLRRWDAGTWLSWGQELATLPDARWLNARVNETRIVLRSNAMDALLQAARNGIGLLLVPAPYLRLDGLVDVPCTVAMRRELEELPPSELWLAGHRAHRDIPRIAAVWDWLVEVFRAA